MLKETIIILLLIALIYYYRQSRKPSVFTERVFVGTDSESANQTLVNFLRNQLNSSNLEELQTKLGSKTLEEILEENQDWETEVDTLTRAKNSLEADLLAQSNAFQNRLREKDREVKKLKEDLASEQKRLQKASENLTSEKQQHKGSLERIKLLTGQIQNLEQEIKDSAEQKRKLEEKLKKMPGEFPEEDK